MGFTVKNLEKKTYKGETSYYAEIDGKRAKLKGFEPSEIKEGILLEGELKEWEYEGKTGYNFWKVKPKKSLKETGADEQRSQIYADIKTVVSNTDLIIEKLTRLTEMFEEQNNNRNPF